MNKSNIYDRNLFKNRFKDIYNEHKFTFSLNDNTLSNIITKWKNTTFKYNKTTILFNRYDYENSLILRDYITIYIETDKRKKPINIECTIWGNDENIGRMRKSKHYFIDVKFRHPPEFSQLLIVIYRDIISELKIPGLYYLMNNKIEVSYDIIFNSIINIIKQFRIYDLDIVTIVTDSETALVKSVKKFFPNARRITCLIYYKQDIKTIKIFQLKN